MKKENQNFSNLAEIITSIEHFHHNNNFLNFLENDKWKIISSHEFVANVKNLAIGLREIGVEKKDSFAILAKPSPIWLMTDFAAISIGAWAELV